MSIFGKRKAADPKRGTEALERPEYGWIWKPLLVLAVLYLVVTMALGIWWSRPPASFDVERASTMQRGGGAEAAAQEKTLPAARGAVTTAALMASIGTLLDKPGGYLRNDLMPPGLWLDNMPNWEYGVLRQSRDMAETLPELATTEHDAFEEIHRRLMASSQDWLYPSVEHRLEQSHEVLGDYLRGLADGSAAGFAASGDGLSRWLARVEGRLDSLTRRLSASVGEREALRDLVDIDADELAVQTPWYQVDDIFFEARGTGWALIHLLEALERDFGDVIEAAGASDGWQQLIAELNMTQRRIWSPMILNGSGFGLFANHSLVMANYTVRARELAADLASRLEGVELEAPGEPSEAAAPETLEPETESAEETSAEEPSSGEEAAPTEESEPEGAAQEQEGAAQEQGETEEDAQEQQEPSAPESQDGGEEEEEAEN
ncbi:hypothetical protein GCM10007160_17830 [Litchfieldella qijiaojingensis]|uniref:DUF2333 family protein n=1 Tax=Litchfieldella qijiaojingensis TaxID=980347 RepID=A0ABQ2YS93_9GAMM|nr:DUF2333 family protein [Halomonas qijiaojingensis]GGX90796.1 hypothetical protein GCM10007160_17830 [Halomonas qijiaojingensis]